jgi:putative transposase
MPARNAVKTYVEGGYYHIYNRGVDRRDIFTDPRDSAVFLEYLKEYLSPKNEKELQDRITNQHLTSRERDKEMRHMVLNNYSAQITLLAYCLMPNHFHLFIKQNQQNSIQQLMKSLGARYTRYFNRSHNREGVLFQGVYKAVLLIDEAHYLHLSRYIHKQAISPDPAKQPDYPSSFPEYLCQRQTSWVHPEEILSYFSTNNDQMSYSAFIAEYVPEPHFVDEGF